MSEPNHLQQLNTNFVSRNFSPAFRMLVLSYLKISGPTFTLSIGLKDERAFFISGTHSFQNGNSIYTIDNRVYRDNEFIIFVQSKYAKFLLEEIADPASGPLVPPPPPQAPCAEVAQALQPPQSACIVVCYKGEYCRYNPGENVLRTFLMGRIIDGVKAGTYRLQEKETREIIEIELREVPSDDAPPPPQQVPQVAQPLPPPPPAASVQMLD
jgi:hypothetical protein